MIHIENEEQFFKEIKEGNVVVDFYANWCGPCRMLSPILEELEEEINIKVLKINVDELSSLASQFFVSSIPLLIFFKNNNRIGDHLGYLPKEDLKDKIIKSFEK